MLSYLDLIDIFRFLCTTIGQNCGWPSSGVIVDSTKRMEYPHRNQSMSKIIETDGIYYSTFPCCVL